MLQDIWHILKSLKKIQFVDFMEKKFPMLKEVFWVEIGYFSQNSIKEKRSMINDNALINSQFLQENM